MTFFFPPDERASLAYRVQLNQPPADSGTASFFRHFAEEQGGEELAVQQLSDLDGEGMVELDLSDKTVDDSPLWLQLEFVKQDAEPDTIRSPAMPFSLAHAAIAELTLPEEAKQDDEVEVEVVWGAACYDEAPRNGSSSEPNLMDLDDPSRIPAAVRDGVAWQVDGQDAEGQGSPFTFTVAEEHLGKALEVQASIVDALGAERPHAVLTKTIAIPKVELVGVPEEGEEQEGDEDPPPPEEVLEGGVVRLRAKVLPEGFRGELRWSAQSDKLRLEPDGDTCVVHGVTKTEGEESLPVKVTLVSQATGAEYEAEAPLQVAEWALRVTLELGKIDALCDAPGTQAARAQRLQVLGLLHAPEGSEALEQTFEKAWEHAKEVLGAADDAAADQALSDAVDQQVVVKEGAGEGAPSELPAEGEFARIVLPGTFRAPPAVGHPQWAFPAPHRHRFELEQAFFTATRRVGAIPLVAVVEELQRDGSWAAAAAGHRVHFQLVTPDEPPDGSEVKAPALRDQTRVSGSNGPSDYVPEQIDAVAAVEGDPQVDNCPVERGGQRRPGAGQASDYFETAERAGFNAGEGVDEPLPVAQASDYPLAVVAETNDAGKAGAIFRPSVQGGDRFKLRAFLDPIGPIALRSDGTEEHAVKADTGTFVVWRQVRISRYIRFDYPSGTPNGATRADLGALEDIDLEAMREPFARCYLHLIVEPTAQRRNHRIGDATWQRAIRYARGRVPERPRWSSVRASQRYNVTAMFLDAATTVGLVEMRDLQPYENNRGGGFPQIPRLPNGNIDPQTALADYRTLLINCLDQVMRYFTRGALSGLTILHAPLGDSITATTPVEMTTSGMGTGRGGAFLFYGASIYARPEWPYDLFHNALHELGHVLLLPHQWTERHTKVTFSNLSGAFRNQEVLDGSISGAGAATLARTSRGYLLVDEADGIRLQAGETLTGQSSGATCTVERRDAGAVGGGIPPEHDYRDYCIMSYQKSRRNDYDYCGRCNLKLRGWDTSGIPRNNG